MKLVFILLYRNKLSNLRLYDYKDYNKIKTSRREVIFQLDNLNRNITTIYEEYFDFTIILIHKDFEILDFHIHKPHKNTRSIRFEEYVLINPEIYSLLSNFNCNFTKSYSVIGQSPETDTTMSIGISSGNLTSNIRLYSAFGVNTTRLDTR